MAALVAAIGRLALGPCGRDRQGGGGRRRRVVVGVRCIYKYSVLHICACACACACASEHVTCVYRVCNNVKGGPRSRDRLSKEHLLLSVLLQCIV